MLKENPKYVSEGVESRIRHADLLWVSELLLGGDGEGSLLCKHTDTPHSASAPPSWQDPQCHHPRKRALRAKSLLQHQDAVGEVSWEQPLSLT